MALRVQMNVDIKNNFDAVGRAVADESSDIVDDMMDMVKDKARLSMKTAKTGRVYVRHGVPHQASAPGQAPAVEPMGFSVTAGQLLASITTMRTGRYSGEVFTAVEYAKYLELGTKTPMAPRPFMRPAARMTRTEMNVIAPEKFRVRIARAAK